MKKILLMMTALLLLTGTSVKAQGWEFQYQGKGVPDSGMVTIAAVEDDWGFGEMWCESNPASDPNNGLVLKLLADKTASGTASISIDENTMDPAVLKWCMGGDCVMFNNKSSLTKNFTITDGLVQVQFDAENARATGYLLATLTATIGTETHTMKIQFTNGASAGVHPIQGSQFMDNGSGAYDLKGRRVEHPTKGIYIHQGKKVIIK